MTDMTDTTEATSGDNAGTKRRHLRRRGALVGVAGVAAGLGLGWSWWRGRAAASADASAALLWSQRFARPQGGELVMSELRGRPLVLNFWATWCAPCVREMPTLEQFHRAQSKGVQVAGIALDSLAPVNAFLKQHPVSFPIGLAGIEGTELLRRLGNEQGLLPYTLVFDANGRIVQRKLGETNASELQDWAAQL